MTRTGAPLTLEELPIPMAVLDRARVVVEANDAFSAALGRASCIGFEFGDLLEAAGAEEVNNDLGKLYRIAKADGVAHSYRVSLSAKGEGAYVVLTDVTTAKDRLGGHVIEEGDRARLLQDAEIGAWVYDPDQDVYYFPAELSLGYGQVGDPLPSHLLQLLQHPEDKAIDMAIRRRITHEGGSGEAEIRYRNANGDWTHLRVLYRAGERRPSGLYEMYGISHPGLLTT